MSEHTPTPFYVGAQNDALYVISGDPPSPSNDYPRHDAARKVIAHVYDADDAAFLALACNSHDALLTALESMLQACVNPTSDGPLPHEAVARARAALVAAKAQP